MDKDELARLEKLADRLSADSERTARILEATKTDPKVAMWEAIGAAAAWLALAAVAITYFIGLFFGTAPR